jgi:hypothetical protein
VASTRPNVPHPLTKPNTSVGPRASRLAGTKAKALKRALNTKPSVAQENAIVPIRHSPSEGDLRVTFTTRRSPTHRRVLLGIAAKKSSRRGNKHGMVNAQPQRRSTFRFKVLLTSPPYVATGTMRDGRRPAWDRGLSAAHSVPSRWGFPNLLQWKSKRQTFWVIARAQRYSS